MSLRPLIIDAEAKAKIADVMAYAEQNVMTAEYMMEKMKDPTWSVSDVPGFQCELEHGFRVVFSLEIQPEMGLCRHISISVAAPNKIPNLEAVKLICSEFGIVDFTDKRSHAYVENLNPPAINIINCKDPMRQDEMFFISTLEKQLERIYKNN